jgi:hypothetical protein
MFARRERSGAYSRHAVEIGALLPHARNQTLRRALQQFSTPLEFAYLASLAAGVVPGEVVLEPSAARACWRYSPRFLAQRSF